MSDISPYSAAHLADKMLEKFDDICHELDIPYCLVFGTCLGFYRDDSYISSDNDIDVKAIYINHDSSPLQQALIAHGFSPSGAPHFEDKHYRKHGILLEVTELRRDGPVYIIDAYIPSVDDFRFTSFDHVTHGSRTYKVPHPIESYLIWQYGEDWETPISKEEYTVWLEIKRGATVVYTSGDWDLFHYGHLEFLKAASQLGAYFIVAVGTDESYRNWKGREPIIPYERRRAMIESLWFVNEVVPFESFEQSVELMRAKDVTIRVISDQHQEFYDEYPEWREGFEYVTIPRTPDVSTTEIKERIKKQ